MNRILSALAARIVSATTRPRFDPLSKVPPPLLLGFIVLLFAAAFISATSPVFSIDKPEDNAIFISGLKSFQKEDYASALQKFTELPSRYPNTPLKDVALFWTSRTYYKMGNKLEAARNMSQLMQLYPETPLCKFAEEELVVLAERYDKGERFGASPEKAEKVAESAVPLPVAKVEPAAIEVPQVKSGALIKGITEGESYIDIVSGSSLEGYRAFKLAQPDRLVIDFPGANSTLATKAISINHLGISRVRVGRGLDAVRVVLDSGHPQFPAYDIKTTENGLRINLTPESVPDSGGSKMRDEVLVKEIAAGESYLDIVTGKSLEHFKAFRLAKPDRLVIDIPGGKCALPAKAMAINGLGISKVRIGKGSAAVRIVLDGASAPFPAYEIIPTESGLRVKLTPRVEVVKEVTAGESSIDIITGNSLDSFKAFILRKPARLVIDIPGAKSAVAATSIPINRLNISRVRIGKGATAVRVVLDAAHASFPAYDVKPFDGGLRINIANR